MKVISIENTNTNTNTLTINLSAPITIAELVAKEEFKNFAPGATSDDICTMDGGDLGLINNIDNLNISDDTVLEISKFGEFKPQTVTAPQQGRIEVLAGGGSLSKSVIIINGITTVRQALNDRVANAFGKTREELQQMKVHVNDEAVGLEATLQDGDKIVLEERKAGKDGSGEYLTIVDGNGCERGFLKEAPEMSLADFLGSLGVLRDFDHGISGADLIDDIDTVDGVDFGFATGNIIDMILDSPVENIEQVTLAVYCFLPPQDEEEPSDEYLKDDEDIPVPADGVGAAQNIPAVGQATVGPVLVSQGGTSPIKVMVTSGQTTLKDVVLSSKVLNTFAMTEQQMSKMLFSVNDVRSQLDVVLRAGDTVVVEAPKCGKDGNLR